MDTSTYTSARGVVAVFMILMSALLVVTVSVDDDAAAFQTPDACSSAMPESCFEIVVVCDALSTGQGTLTISYVGTDPLTSSSPYVDGLGGFYTASEYPASFDLMDGSWKVSAFASTATGSLAHAEDVWVSCGYVCASGEMDNCASVCDIDGAIIGDECFMAVVECIPNGFVQVTLGPTPAGLVAASDGSWEAQLTTYSSNMQINAQTVGFASTDNATFMVDPLPNGSYRVVVELQSLSDATVINSAVSAIVDCGSTPCPDGECVFEITTAELSCTGTIQLVIVGSVLVLNADQLEAVTIVINGTTLPAESITGIGASDLQPPYPNGDGIRDTVVINVADDLVTPADTYEVVAMIDGADIYSRTFAATLTQTIAGAGCTDVTVDCASQTVSAEVLLPEDLYEAGWYEIPGAFASDAVSVLAFDANGVVVDWAPQQIDDPYQVLRVTNPLTVSFANAAQPLTWQIGNSIDWGFFTAADVARLANGELQEIWIPWKEGTIECAPSSISVTPTVVPCTSASTQDGSIELTPALTNGATLTSITFDASGEQRTSAPYSWTGLNGGTYSFTADSNPAVVIASVTVPDCPIPMISLTPAVEPCTTYAGNAQIVLTPLLSGEASLTSVTLVETGQELTVSPLAWTDLNGGTYTFTVVSTPSTTVDPITVDPCPDPVISIESIDTTCATTNDGAITIEASAAGGAALTISIDGVAQTFDTAAPTAFTWTGLTADTYGPVATPQPDYLAVTGVQPVMVPLCAEPSITLSPTVTCAASGASGSVSIDVETVGGASLGGVELLGAQTRLIAAPGPFEWAGLNAGIYQVVVSRPEPSSAYVIGQGLVAVSICDSITITSTVLPCATAVEPNGSIELVVELSGAASVTSITLVESGQQITSAPFVWGGLSDGTYTFAVDSEPGATVSPVLIGSCPPEDGTVTFTPMFECVLGTGSAKGSVLIDLDVQPADAVTFTGVRVVETGTEIAAPGPYFFDELAPGPYTFQLIDAVGATDIGKEAVFLLPYCLVHYTKCSSHAVGEGEIKFVQLNAGDQSSITLEATGETITGPGPFEFVGLLPGTHTFSSVGLPLGITVEPIEVLFCSLTISDVIIECDSALIGSGSIEIDFAADPGAFIGSVTLDPGDKQTGSFGASSHFLFVDAGNYTVAFPESRPSIAPLSVTVLVCPEAILIDVVTTCPGGGQPATLTFDVETYGAFMYSGVTLTYVDADALTPVFRTRLGPGPYEFTTMVPGLHTFALIDPSSPTTLTINNSFAGHRSPSCAELEIVSVQSTCSISDDGTVIVEATSQRPGVEVTLNLKPTAQLVTATGPHIFVFSDVAPGIYTFIEHAGAQILQQSSDPLDFSVGEPVEVLECVSSQPDTIVVECAADDGGSISFTFDTEPEIASIELLGGGEVVVAPGLFMWTGLATGPHNFAIDAGERLVMDPIIVPACPGMDMTFDILCSSGSDGRVEVDTSLLGGLTLNSITLDLFEAGLVVDSQTVSATGPFVFEGLASGLHRVVVDSDPLLEPNESVFVAACALNVDVYHAPLCDTIALEITPIGASRVNGIVMQPGNVPIGTADTLTVLSDLDPGIYTFEVDSHPALILEPLEVLGCPEISIQSLATNCSNGGGADANGEIRLSVSTGGPVVLSGLTLHAETIAAPGPYVWSGLTPGLKTITVDSDIDLSLAPIDIPACPEFGVPSTTVDCDATGSPQVGVFVIALNAADVDAITLTPGGQTFSGPGPYLWTNVKPGAYTFEVVSKPALFVDPVVVGQECPSVELEPTWVCDVNGSATVSATIKTTGLQVVNSVSFGIWNSGTNPPLVAPDTAASPGPYEWTGVDDLPAGLAYGLTVDAAPLNPEVWLVFPGGCELDSTHIVACAAPGVADGSVQVALTDADVLGSDATDVERVSIDGASLSFERSVEAPGPFLFDELEAGAYVVQIGKIPDVLARHEVLVPECAQAVAVAASCAAIGNGTITIALTGDNDVDVTVDGVTNVNVGSWTGLAAGTYKITASETVVDLPREIEVPACPKSAPLTPVGGAVSAIISAGCDGDGQAVVRVEADKVAGAVVVGFAINGTFGSRAIVPNGAPIKVVILTANANDNTSLSGPSLAPICLVVSQASSEPEGPQFIVLPVPAVSPAPAALVVSPVSSPPTTVSVPLPPGFLDGVIPPGGLQSEDADEEEADETAAADMPDPAKSELVSSAPPAPSSDGVPEVVSAGITRSGPSEIVLPATCDVDQIEIDGVNNLVREGFTEDGRARFTADGAQLDVGTHRFEVDCDGTFVSIELFVYRQIGGSRGEGNSVARLASLSGLLLLVITGATSVAKSKFADIAMGGTNI